MPARALPPERRGFSCSPCTPITCAGSTLGPPSPRSSSELSWEPDRAGERLKNWGFEGAHAIPWAGTGLEAAAFLRPPPWSGCSERPGAHPKEKPHPWGSKGAGGATRAPSGAAGMLSRLAAHLLSSLRVFDTWPAQGESQARPGTPRAGNCREVAIPDGSSVLGRGR